MRVFGGQRLFAVRAHNLGVQDLTATVFDDGWRWTPSSQRRPPIP